VLQPQEQKQVYILQVVRTRNEPANKNELLLVSHRGREVEEDPKLDPTGRGLLRIQLGTVDREHKDNIVPLDAPVIKRVDQVGTM